MVIYYITVFNPVDRYILIGYYFHTTKILKVLFLQCENNKLLWCPGTDPGICLGGGTLYWQGVWGPPTGHAYRYILKILMTAVKCFFQRKTSELLPSDQQRFPPSLSLFRVCVCQVHPRLNPHLMYRHVLHAVDTRFERTC